MESELLMREFELTEEHSNQQISDLHLEVISRTSSKQWRSLPPYLELPDTNILVGDIERDGQNEGERRHNFFFTWKDKKGTLATYRMLVHALLKINCRGDAEKVCKLLLESVSTRRRNFAPPVKTKPSQPTSDEVYGANVKKGGRGVAKRGLSNSPTQDQSPVREGTVEPKVYGANVKKDGRRAVKRDLSASPTQDQRSSSVKRLKSEGTAEPTEVYGASVKKDGRRAAKRDLSASPTQDQSSVKRIKSERASERTAEPEANVKKDGSKSAKRDLSTSPTQDQSSVKTAKSKGCAYSGSHQVKDFLNENPGVHFVDSRVFSSCFPKIKPWLNLELLAPHLYEYGVAKNAGDMDALTSSYFKRQDKMNSLIKLLEEAGSDGFMFLYMSLKASSDESLGHQNTVREMDHAMHKQKCLKCLEYGQHASASEDSARSFERELAQKDPLQSLISNLKACYIDPIFFTESSGPNFGTLEYISLALVKKENVSANEKANDKFLRESLHGSVEDIVKRKERINHRREIFNYESSGARKLILVEGAPGVGKTMLALKLCQDWAMGKIFLQEYDLVLLVRLRQFQTEASLSLEDLVKDYCEEDHARGVADILSKSGGERTLLIFEGWDELHPSQRQKMSLFHKIITPFKLSKASVLVTSRPTATEKLANYMGERHVEVLGFQPEQIAQYVERNFPQKSGIILNHFESFPNLKALAHIPLTLSIICKVVKNEETLPSTLTELYDRYICQVLFQATQRGHTSLIGLESMDDLPPDLKADVKELCKVALQGLENRKCVFTQRDLAHSVSNEYDGHGLLTIHRVPAKAGERKLYQFNHLSIQEFLAALQIQSQLSQDCVRLLKEYGDDKQFQNVWKFLAGITKLKDKAFSSAVLSTTKLTNESQLFLIHCLYEAHDKDICQLAASKLKWKLNLNNKSLNANDCLCAAYAIVSAGGQWDLDLKNCNIGANGIKIFKHNMIDMEEKQESQCDEFSVRKFDLSLNHITLEACRHLAEMLESDMDISTLLLSANKFEDEGAEVICNALSSNKTLSVINFSRCGLTSQSGTIIQEMLEKNTTLMELDAGYVPLEDGGVVPIFRALTKNHTLTELKLTKTQITIKSIEELQIALTKNNTLKVLRLDWNNLKLADAVAKILSNSSTLVFIDISKNPIGDDGFGVIMDGLVKNPKSSLERFKCLGCGITGKGLPKLVPFFAETKTFKELVIGNNDLGDEGAKFIGKAVIANKSQSVILVQLEKTGFSPEAEAQLERDRRSLNRPPEKELDINYTPHVNLHKIRQSDSFLNTTM